MSTPIPTIDISSTTPLALSQSIKSAVSSVGFLHLTGTKVTQEDINKAFGVGKEFFDLPREVKRKEEWRSDGKNGYMGFKASRLGEGKGEADLKENFVYGRYPPSENKTVQHLPEPFVKNLKELEEIHAKLYEVTGTILDACALALNLPIDYFRSRHRAGSCGLAFNNYPEVSKEDAKVATDSARASAHKDWGSITLLLQEENGAPGLEIFLPDAAVEASKEGTPYKLYSEADAAKGKWFQAPIVPGSILVNLGLALEAWTGGLFVATLHRVISHPNEEQGGIRGRRSIAYFVQPSDDVVLNRVSEDGTIQQDSHAITSGEFFKIRMENTIKAVEVEVTA